MIRSDTLLPQLQALANPVRLWIVARLHQHGPHYVSELARAAGISRPLLKMHLRKLEDAQLVTSKTGTADNGKSANFFQIVSFDLPLTPAAIADTQAGSESPATRKDGDFDA
ncbi:winged helix-turn-helix domain-containing protein [Rhodobacteraceae bacterium N5(2021)]|uniref:Winged helix-turn-helix domain-containing protein n=1 Tax=Gymnodinialimonas phycosphaerae TaxID=2841589 RepID=A0A975TU11_9RHOB|nr:winged helix-turn-helix domain-containing protein [Gymnodinialimonas phycosphaerae]MBY4894790.1 winged helix-turn-helix domain-containing protein [Gymnodinialimonas phycosphaerae]